MELIKYGDSLRQGTDKLNSAITHASEAKEISEQAIQIANTATENADEAALTANQAAENANTAAELANGEAADLNELKTDVIEATSNANNAADNAQQIANEIRTIWQAPVVNFADIATTYPNPTHGWTVMVSSTGEVYRYNFDEWILTQVYTDTSITDVQNKIGVIGDEVITEFAQNFGGFGNTPTTPIYYVFKATRPFVLRSVDFETNTSNPVVMNYKLYKLLNGDSVLAKEEKMSKTVTVSKEGINTIELDFDIPNDGYHYALVELNRVSGLPFSSHTPLASISDVISDVNAKFETGYEVSNYFHLNWKIAPSIESRMKIIKQDVSESKKSINDLSSQLAETGVDNFRSNKFLEMPDDFLQIPSALSNSLTTHPSIVDFGENNSWNKYRYWLAHTPYPGIANENPSIAVSNDNVNWVVPENAPNPLVGKPTEGYYSDVELVYLEDLNRLRLYYRQAGTSDKKQKLYFIESNDGSNWTAPQLSFETTNQMLSPSIIRDETGWKIWTVESKTEFGYRESVDGIVWGTYHKPKQPWKYWSAWHIGVIKTSDGKYHMMGSTWEDIGSGQGTQYRPIVYASSNDGWYWTANEKPQLIPTGWAGGYLYRPSFLIDESMSGETPYAKIWFGASEDNLAAGWHIGYAEGYIMDGNSNPSATNVTVKRKKIGEYFKVFASNIITPFAKIGRLLTKRIEVKSDYSQPLIEMYDGRNGRNGGNFTRLEYQGADNPSNIRMFLNFTDDNGNSVRMITLHPFQDYITLAKPTTISNIRTIDSSGSFSITALDDQGKRFNLVNYSSVSGGAFNGMQYISFSKATSIANAPNGALFEDSDGKLKYKNRAGVVTVLTV